MIDRAEIIRLLVVNAYHAWNNCLVGDPTPRIAELYKELSNPQVGDMVLETSTFGRKRRTPAIGRLTKVAREPAYPTDEWNESEDGPMPLDTFWYLTGLDGDEQRWANCTFIKVLEQYRPLSRAGEARR